MSKKTRGWGCKFFVLCHNAFAFRCAGSESENKKIAKKRGEEVLENYAKAVLYAYPLLETVEKDYEEHIYNKAILSYRSEKRAEELAEYIAGEILEQRKLSWLKNLLKKALRGLSETEMAFLDVRYFGKSKKIKRPVAVQRQKDGELSRSKYFREQRRLGNKMGERLVALGLSKEVFEREFEKMKLFQDILKRMDKQSARKE